MNDNCYQQRYDEGGDEGVFIVSGAQRRRGQMRRAIDLGQGIRIVQPSRDWFILPPASGAVAEGKPIRRTVEK
jgi:hypothetical protein